RIADGGLDVAPQAIFRYSAPPRIVLLCVQPHGVKQRVQLHVVHVVERLYFGSHLCSFVASVYRKEQVVWAHLRLELCYVICTVFAVPASEVALAVLECYQVSDLLRKLCSQEGVALLLHLCVLCPYGRSRRHAL